ncbi:alanine/glycine:cation symporter family protein [Aureliella helgolandensis]|uniref:Amino-acid carrier protein AlsT n=1 Tax=Aureliella helgolandensis TaxID=2527968 RepID=A0A518G8F0_9BACT|nr:alanine/glycine:cation symporter family protein [Aureliella helgolandensis]QDV24859.1 Amino-acid carrier protein AlsT [Aureliella helgolandensis]
MISCSNWFKAHREIAILLFFSMLLGSLWAVPLRAQDTTLPDPASTTEVDGGVTAGSTVEAEADATPKPQEVDEWIDAKFKPIADGWESLVLTSIPLPFSANEEGKYKRVPFVLILLVSGALFFTLAFGFINIRLLPFATQVVSGKFDSIEKLGTTPVKHVDLNELDGDIVDTIRDESETGEVSHFQALATAVSGTVGLGNISGVAVAVAMGGPGATFWMIICGLLGMSTKFVECTLGVKYRDLERDGTVHGGPMYYLHKGLGEMGLGPLGRILGIVFAILCIGASFGGGNAFQANQAAAQIKTMMHLEGGAAGAAIGVVMALLVGVVIIGGIKRIATVTEKVVPLMAIIYVLAALVIIIVNIQSVPEAFVQIFEGAFSPSAGLGGIVGVIVVGFQRAAFSNEAGAGSAAIAHSAVRTRYPASEGVVALLEPFIDTVVICTMTALVIVLFNINGLFPYSEANNAAVMVNGTPLGGVDLTSAAFDSVLPGFRYVLTIAIILFAFSTMISWSYYGLQSWKYLFGRSLQSDIAYKVVFCLFIVVGAGATLDSVIRFSDAMILALVFPNMLGLLLMFPKVRSELHRYLIATGVKRGPAEQK